MTPVLRFVGTAWAFSRRQPALQRSNIALVYLPVLAMRLLDGWSGVDRPEQAAVLVVLYLACFALLTWGIACTLLVGKRLLQAKAGRLRTSFKAVRTRAKALIVPLILTDILRGCIAALWSLPAILLAFVALTVLDLPAIQAAPLADGTPFLYLAGVCFLLLLPAWYLVRTTLAPHVVAYEKLAFRQALARSAQLTAPRMGRTLGVTALLALFWLPGSVVEVLFARFRDPVVSPAFGFFAQAAVSSAFDTLALVTWLLVLTQFYKALGGKAKASAEDNDE